MTSRRNCWSTAAVFVLLLLPVSASSAEDWPGWRGPEGNNHSAAKKTPTHWGKEENIAWSVEVPGRGHASPCICGDQIFLATADDELETQSLLCFDRDSGALRWQKQLHHGKLPAVHSNNSQASATPACDGEAVFVALVSADELWLSSVDLKGAIRWQERIGGFRHANGFGSSPVVYGETVIVLSDNQEEPGLVAMARRDGHVVWRTGRPNSDNSATPIVARIAGRDQLLVNGAKSVSSYDPATGRELWHVTHECEVAANTMAFDQECVYASGNVPQKMFMAIRADGSGDISDTHVLWNLNRSNPYVPSPLVIGDRLITILDNGTVVCRESRTGDEVWKRRMSGNFFSSPVFAGNHVYAVSELGIVYVFDVGEKFKSVAENDVGETCMATPAICDDGIYLRTTTHLVCIREGS